MKITDLRENFRPFQYPIANEFAKLQNDHFWTADQIEVDADVAQYHTLFTDAEKHGIETVLKLFTTYEISVADYWVDVVYKHFKCPEVRLMAKSFASMEGIHALFYDKLNTAIGLGNEDFYLSWMDDEHMSKRMKDIGKALSSTNTTKELALSLATFAFIEGVVLYSSFAFLMSFQRPPHNKLKNVTTGLAYSVRDECLHADADCWLFNTFIKEENIDINELKDNIIKIVDDFMEVEYKIIDNIFAKGEIKGIDAASLKSFAKSRANKKLGDINIEPIYEVKENPIASWFYLLINTVEVTDFFDRDSTEYTNNWNFSKIKEW